MLGKDSLFTLGFLRGALISGYSSLPFLAHKGPVSFGSGCYCCVVESSGMGRFPQTDWLLEYNGDYNVHIKESVIRDGEYGPTSGNDFQLRQYVIIYTSSFILDKVVKKARRRHTFLSPRMP